MIRPLFDMALRLIGIAWKLLPLVGVLALVVVLTSSASAARLRSDLARAGRRPTVSFFLLVLLLSAQVGTGAIERRVSGPSPFSQLAGVGGVIGKLGAPHVTDLLMIAVSGLVLFRALLTSNAPGNQPRSVAKNLVIAWIALTLLTTAFNAEGTNASQWVPLLATAASSLAVLTTASSLPPELLSRAVSWLAVLLVMVNVYVAVLGSEWAHTEAWPGGFLEGSRFTGTLPQPNVAGVLTAFAMVVALYARRWPMAGRLLLGVPAGVLTAMSGSRGAVVLLAAMLAYALWLRARKIRVAGAAFVLVVAAVVIPFSSAVGYRAINGRDITWAAARATIQESWVFGNGVFHSSGYTQTKAATYAHNQVLQTAIESGVVGLLVLLAVVLVILRHLPGGRGSMLYGATFVGVLSTFPFENPVRMFELPFAPLLSIFLLAVVGGTTTPREVERRVSAEPVRVAA